MNKKPVILRTIIAAVVILVFALSMIPLAERPFYDTFKSMVKKDAAVADALINDAKAIQEKNADIYPSQALLSAADNKGVRFHNAV